MAPGLGDLLAGARLAVGCRPIEGDDPGAELLDQRPLGGGDVGGDVHGRLDAEDLGGAGDGSAVVPRRHRDDAERTIVDRDRRQPVEGAAELERSGALLRFVLAEHRGADQGVESRPTAAPA